MVLTLSVMKRKPVKTLAIEPGQRIRSYSKGYAEECAALVGHLSENPLMSNAELRIVTGYSDWCIRNVAGKARTIVRNNFKKSA